MSSPTAAGTKKEEEAGARRSGPRPGGAERAAGEGEAKREGARAPPAGRTRSPAAGQRREGLAVLVSGTDVSDTATDLASGPRPSCSGNGDESPNSISKNPDGLYIVEV